MLTYMRGPGLIEMVEGSTINMDGVQMRRFVTGALFWVPTVGKRTALLLQVWGVPSGVFDDCG